MKKTKQEKTILNIIKYGPVIFVLALSFIITQVVLEDKKQNFEQELKNYKETFILNNKTRIQEEVEEIYKYVLSEKSKADAQLKESIKNKVYDAHKIATSIYNANTNEDEHKHTDEHILNSIKDALGAMTYNKGRGYIFIDDAQGTKLLQPFNKELEGKNLLEFQDAKGYKFVKKIVHTIKNKTEAYDSYYWYKEGDTSKSFKKISFYKYFEPLNIAIGTGEYVKDFENELKEKVLERIQNKRYGNNGYIFVYDKKGTCLSHLKRDLIGTNRFNYQDKKGSYLVQEIINLAEEKKSAFISYNASVKPSDSILNYSKISFIKLFEEWGWVIGTGFYTDILEQEIEKKKLVLEESNSKALEQIIYYSIFITFIFILISFFVSKFIEVIFNEYKYNLDEELKKTIEKERLLIQQSKMATMGEMIGHIAHQWKQPLSLISLSSGLINYNRVDSSISTKEEIDHAFEVIDNSVEHLANTINDFRNFFKPNKEKQYFKINETFNKSSKLIDSLFTKNGIKIIRNIENIELNTFENELLQVILNIMKNAKDELIKVEEDKRFLFIDVITNEKNVTIFIKDSAGGIDEEIIDKIFESYFTTKSEDEGTGVGLYMSQQIITNMQGTLSVKNVVYTYNDKELKGAEFKIEIPL